MADLDRFTCEEVFRRLDDYLDRELSTEEMRLVREHIATCAACAAEHRFEQRVLEDVKDKLRRIAMPAGLLDKVHAAILRAQAEAPP
ncbi:MAG TPA: zf-HC2 domain-containing protein [Gemmatimonadales bacterium]|jgi:anti-sigma factor (TIGR02949 family)|nr:zf-HC2 domain-containing protein [Gemmatimonadales bacterium]